MAAVTVDDILSDLPLGFASLMLRPVPADAAIERFLIVDADDEAPDGSAAFVLLIGVRGRSALPALRRLLKNTPLPVVAVKGTRAELSEAEELLSAAGTGLLVVDPGADWDRLLSIAKDRIQPRSYQSEVLTLLEEDLFAIAQTTARLTSSHVVIEDAANKVLAYSTVSNDIDELRKASILARRGPRKYELLLKDLGAYRELHQTRLPVRVPARPQDGLRERVAITLFAGDRIMGYIWLQETGAGFGPDVDHVLKGSAARTAAELIRYRNQQSVHMREDRVARILSGTAEAAASAHSEKISADRPAALILIGMSDAEAQADDAALKHGELANLAAIHAAAYKASAVVGQFKGDTAVIVPGLKSSTWEPGLKGLAESIVRDAGKHLGISPFAAVGPVAPDLLSLHSITRITEALLGCVGRASRTSVATVDDFEGEILVREAVRNFSSSTFRHRSLSALLQQDAELAETLRVYFDASMDVAECAKQMKLHKNTVYYRISKASRVTGLDFGNPRDSLVALLHTQEWTGTSPRTAGRK
ncbi:PucR family transcriptional regulator [Pseudarthrobacter phenanthrenivorans]|uniref:PucR family transcriptional regulator n=1 Tax=Pseudarthrobacter phenanthrenivorans TaxID=361575 RepID=UPI001129AB5D|nr:helix-turn-helix domain-containing protein [Pseudarthrobacter phenanthrenivorans]TPV50135.1 PucR family transcriptional regulator [Pseudarthrobacter phenanthrenivorans]